MKLVFVIALVLTSVFCYSQKAGLEFLAYGKSIFESSVKEFLAIVPDSSATFQKYRIPLGITYSKVKAEYDGYRGAMKDCLLNNGAKKKITKCIQSKSPDARKAFDTLQQNFTLVLLEYLSINGEKTPNYTGTKTGLITGEIIKSMFDTLLNGAMKAWEQAQKFRKQYRDEYFAQINAKEYDLLEFAELVSKFGKK